MYICTVYTRDPINHNDFVNIYGTYINMIYIIYIYIQSTSRGFINYDDFCVNKDNIILFFFRTAFKAKDLIFLSLFNLNGIDFYKR